MIRVSGFESLLRHWKCLQLGRFPHATDASELVPGRTAMLSPGDQ
jgi:hypothetical protein